MPELTNSIRKMVAQLDAAKYRKRERAFRVEGTKCVLDTMPGFDVRLLLATADWHAAHPGLVAPERMVTCRHADLERMSGMGSVPDVIAVLGMPEKSPALTAPAPDELMLALDTVQDPGNLGTIIRTADWFGIDTILCNEATADPYSPKVVQATMGALARVRVVRVADLAAELARYRDCGVPVYGTFLDGTSIYTTRLSRGGIIVMGSEGHGISPEVEAQVTHRLLIPSYPPDGDARSESLNVSVAAAITMAAFRRQLI